MNTEDAIKLIKSEVEETLPSLLLERWKIEEELSNASADHISELQEKRDKSENEYNQSYESLRGILNDISSGDEEQINQIMKRVGNIAYKYASDSF